MKRLKAIFLYFLFSINLIIFIAYGILDLFDLKVIDKLDMTLLLVYEIISYILFTEILHEKKED